MSYSQNDPRWKNIQLGTSEYTIGQAGCYLTSLCETAKKLGHDITPDWLNATLLTMGGDGFVQGGLIARDDILHLLFPDIIYLGSESWFGNTTNLSFFDDNYTIVEIDSSPAKGVQTHFMPVIERQGDALLVDDSWDGQRKLSSAYRGDYGTDNIYKGIKYQKEVTEVIELQPPVFDAGYYLSANPDVAQAGADAKTHWLEYGISEGRASTATFHVQEYVAMYDDIRKAYGSDYKSAIYHYFNAGINEGRYGCFAARDADDALKAQAAEDQRQIAEAQKQAADALASGNATKDQLKTALQKISELEARPAVSQDTLNQIAETNKNVKSIKGTLANVWGGVKKLLGGK